MAAQTVSELASQVAADTTLQDRIKADPVAALSDLAAPLQSDVWIYRGVVAFLGTVIVIAIIGAIILAANGLTIPDVLTALGSAAVGALAGLLAPTQPGR